MEYQVVHAIEGRFRIRIPLLETDANFAGLLQQKVESLPYVTSVRINPRAQSLVITYREKKVVQEAMQTVLEAAIAQLLPPVPPKDSPPPADTSPLPIAEPVPPVDATPATADPWSESASADLVLPQPEAIAPPLESTPTVVAPADPEAIAPPASASTPTIVALANPEAIAPTPSKSLTPTVAPSAPPADLTELPLENPNIQEDATVNESNQPDLLEREPVPHSSDGTSPHDSPDDSPDNSPHDSSNPTNANDLATSPLPAEPEALPQTLDAAAEMPLVLSSSALAKRLDVHLQLLNRYRSKPDFKSWSAEQDPEGLMWVFQAETKTYQALKSVN